MNTPGAVPHIQTDTLPPHHEAAVMYADGRTDDTKVFLQRALAAPETSEDPRLWALLLTLYRIEGDWTAFDTLAARFRSRFDRHPPVWPGDESLYNLPAALRPGGEAYAALAGALDQRCAGELSKVRRLAASHPSLHLDLSRVEGLDAHGAAGVSGLLRFLASNGNALLITGAANLIDLLREAVAGDGGLSAYWTLLLDLYQFEGNRVDFERAAVEYALSANVPVPDWEAVVMPLPPRSELREQRDEPRYLAGPEVIALSGVITGTGDEQLTAIEEFARERQYVNIDVSELARIAPVAAAELVRLTSELCQTRKVRLLRPSPFVEALLETLQPHPAVELIRAKSA